MVIHTKIATIPDEIIVQESFQSLKDYVYSVLKGQVSRCQLLYEPSEYKPYCYLFLSRYSRMNPNAVWTKMKSDTAPTTEYPFSVIIESDDNLFLGENPEFNTFDKNEVEDLDWTTVPGGVDVNAPDFFDELTDSFEDTIVMFGHCYNYLRRRWDSSIAIWLCFEDPIKRYFLATAFERRDKSYKGIPIHYFSANFSVLSNKVYPKIKIDDIAESGNSHTPDDWSSITHAPDGNLSCGMGFLVRKAKCERGYFTGSLGPQVQLFDPTQNPNLFFVSKHVFNEAADTFIYSRCDNPKEIGHITTVHKFLDVAIVELTCGYTADVKINAVNDRLVVNDFIPFSDRPHKQSFKKSDWRSLSIFKSGQTTGITKGHIYSWGCRVGKNPKFSSKKYEIAIEEKIEANPNAYHHKDHYIFIVGKGFVSRGDSGGPVVAIEQESGTAKFVGIVECKMDFGAVEICAILPILHSFCDGNLFYTVEDAGMEPPNMSNLYRIQLQCCFPFSLY